MKWFFCGILMLVASPSWGQNSCYYLFLKGDVRLVEDIFNVAARGDIGNDVFPLVMAYFRDKDDFPRAGIGLLRHPRMVELNFHQRVIFWEEISIAIVQKSFGSWGVKIMDEYLVYGHYYLGPAGHMLVILRDGSIYRTHINDLSHELPVPENATLLAPPY